MKTYIIQLEDHDDVISARDKLSWSKARRILLVWPRKGRVLERRVDLLLLLRQSQQLGAQLALVTSSSVVKAEARDLGILVFADALEAQETSWRRPRSRRKIAARLGYLRKRRPVDPLKLRERRLADLRARREAFTTRLSKNLWVRLAMLTLGVLAFLALVLAFVPGARVLVNPAREAQALDISVWASPGIPAPSASGGLPAESMLVVVEGRDQVESSGQVEIPDRYAAGQVTLTNLTSQAVLVPVGSVLRTTTNLVVRFATTQAVTVPAGPGNTEQVVIRAELPGRAGNQTAGNIRAVEGSIGSSLLVSNNEPTSGGTDRLSRSPTEADYHGLHEKLLASLQANALEEARVRVKPGQRLLDGVVVLREVIEENREPPSGQPADRLQLALRVEFIAYTVREDDLQAVAQAALDANREAHYRPVPGSQDITFSSQPVLDQQGDVGAAARWSMRVEQLIEKNWTEEAAVRSIQGRGLAEARQILEENMVLSEPPQINIYPSWWKRMPFLPARIEVVGP